MIFILINFLFNGFLLSIAYTVAITGFASQQSCWYHAPDWAFFALGYGTVLLLTIIGSSKFGAYLLRLGARNATLRERQKIDPLLKEVLNQANKIKQAKFKYSNLHIRVKNSHEANAQALGYNTIIVTEGLLNNTSDYELQAVLAHEVGHLYHKDSQMLLALFYGSFAIVVVMWLYAIYAKFITGFSRLSSKSGFESMQLIFLFMLIPQLLFLPLVLLHWIGSNIFNLSLLFMGRRYEYRADKFTKDLGYQAGLINYLEQVPGSSGQGNTFLGKIFATHPSAIERIDKLERKENPASTHWFL